VSLVSQLGPGTLPQWGTFAAVLAMLAGMVTVWIKGIPERLRVRNEARMQIGEAEERLRTELMNDRARCETELRIMKHRERGSRQLIYSLLHLFDMPPGEAREGAVANVRATLSELERAEADETARVAEFYRTIHGTVHL
jgi:hypothetical protein